MCHMWHKERVMFKFTVSVIFIGYKLYSASPFLLELSKFRDAKIVPKRVMGSIMQKNILINLKNFVVG